MDLTGQVAVVTGGTRGLGLAISRALHDAGATVVAASRTGKSSNDEDDGIIRETVDVTDSESVTALMRKTAQFHGGPHLVVANAGVSRNAAVVHLSDENWRMMLDTNVSGTLYTLRAAAQTMRESSGGGCIITISSCMAQRPPEGAVAYAATKSAIERLSVGAAYELAKDGIRVLCISPGILDTGLGETVTDNARLWARYRKHLVSGAPGKAADIGHLVAFLASTDTSYLTGSVIVADGGVSYWG